jgi:hypothetical protein
MAKWMINRNWPAGPTPGSDRDAAFAFELSAEGLPSRQITVEYAGLPRLHRTRTRCRQSTATAGRVRRVLGVNARA